MPSESSPRNQGPETHSETGGSNSAKDKEYHVLTKIPMALSVPLLGRTLQLESPKQTLHRTA